MKIYLQIVLSILHLNFAIRTYKKKIKIIYLNFFKKKKKKKKKNKKIFFKKKKKKSY